MGDYHKLGSEPLQGIGSFQQSHVSTIAQSDKGTISTLGILDEQDLQHIDSDDDDDPVKLRLGTHGSSSKSNSSNKNNGGSHYNNGSSNTSNIINDVDDNEEFGDWDPIDADNVRLYNHEESYTDNYGNLYGHIDFDAKRYTSKLRFKGQRLVYFTSAFVSLFVSLFGYEQGVCSGILTFVTFNMYFHNPTPTQIGLVISILEVGAMISSLLVSKISDTVGRKRTILLGTVIFMIGGTLQSFAVNMWIFGVGRVFSGFGVGILSTMVPLYQCEISPSDERGKLVCGEFTGNIAGYFLSVWVDYFCYFIQNVGDARKNPHTFAANLSWRLPLFIQVFLAMILLIGGFFIVESPRWLLDVDDDQRGFHVLCLLYEDHDLDDKAVKEFFLIKNSILHERTTTPKSERTWRHMFRHYRLRIFIACSALAFAQFNGINIISYYAPMVFEQAGFNNSKALLMTGVNATVYLLSTIPPWFLADWWGRKPILISGGISMGICLSLIALFMWLDVLATPLLVALLVIFYNASFGFSWGPIGFLIPPEVYPLSVRSKGVSLSTASNWLANYVVGQLTPVLQDRIGWVMYLFPATSCVLSVATVMYFYPETKGVELEDIDRLFDEYYGVSKPKYAQMQPAMELDEFDYELGVGKPENSRST